MECNLIVILLRLDVFERYKCLHNDRVFNSSPVVFVVEFVVEFPVDFLVEFVIDFLVEFVWSLL